MFLVLAKWSKPTSWLVIFSVFVMSLAMSVSEIAYASRVTDWNLLHQNEPTPATANVKQQATANPPKKSFWEDVLTVLQYGLALFGLIKGAELLGSWFKKTFKKEPEVISLQDKFKTRGEMDAFVMQLWAGDHKLVGNLEGTIDVGRITQVRLGEDNYIYYTAEAMCLATGQNCAGLDRSALGKVEEKDKEEEVQEHTVAIYIDTKQLLRGVVSSDNIQYRYVIYDKDGVPINNPNGQIAYIRTPWESLQYGCNIMVELGRLPYTFNGKRFYTEKEVTTVMRLISSTPTPTLGVQTSDPNCYDYLDIGGEGDDPALVEGIKDGEDDQQGNHTPPPQPKDEGPVSNEGKGDPTKAQPKGGGASGGTSPGLPRSDNDAIPPAASVENVATSDISFVEPDALGINETVVYELDWPIGDGTYQKVRIVGTMHVSGSIEQIPPLIDELAYHYNVPSEIVVALNAERLKIGYRTPIPFGWTVFFPATWDKTKNKYVSSIPESDPFWKELFQRGAALHKVFHKQNDEALRTTGHL